MPQVVSNVVTALGPSIAAAVEQALAAQAAQQSRLQAKAAARAAPRTTTVEEPSDPPKYNFEYKVADEQDQTYISQNEIRDGDELTGTYSFVDPRGALITVNYEAGPMGYSETRDEKLDFVQIRSKPARIAPAPAPQLDQATLIQRILAMIQPQISEAVSSALSARREAEAARIAAERQAAEQAAAARAQAEAAARAQAEAAARAQAEAAVRAQAEAAARAQAEAAARARAEAAARAAAEASVNTNSLSLFGDGGFNVRVETPNFKIEY